MPLHFTWLSNNLCYTWRRLGLVCSFRNFGCTVGGWSTASGVHSSDWRYLGPSFLQESHIIFVLIQRNMVIILLLSSKIVSNFFSWWLTFRYLTCLEKSVEFPPVAAYYHGWNLNEECCSWKTLTPTQWTSERLVAGSCLWKMWL